MQLEMTFAEKANAVEAYKPMAINREGNKLWFSYYNAVGKAITAYYDYASRSFKQVVEGKQYGEGVAIRNLVAKPVVEGVLGK